MFPAAPAFLYCASAGIAEAEYNSKSYCAGIAGYAEIAVHANYQLFIKRKSAG